MWHATPTRLHQSALGDLAGDAHEEYQMFLFVGSSLPTQVRRQGTAVRFWKVGVPVFFDDACGSRERAGQGCPIFNDETRPSGNRPPSTESDPPLGDASRMH